MEHPTYEQLLAHLEGTSPAESAKKVKEHLQSCPECSAEIAGWQRTIKQLEKCEWPKPDQVRPGFSAAMPTWAVAAAVFILVIGFGIGRLYGPNASQLKQTVAAEVKRQVQDELKADLLAALAASEPAGTSTFQQQLRRELASTLGSNQISVERQQLVQEIVNSLQQKQDENQRTLLALLYQVRQEHEADYLSLRHDLETAVSVADNDLEQHRRQLRQLAATLLAKNQN